MIKYTKDGSFDCYDVKRIDALMRGEVEPDTEPEKILISYIGGARMGKWPEQWRECMLCGVEWKAKGHPGKGGTWQYSTICAPCSDLWDAGLHPQCPRYWEGKKEPLKKSKGKVQRSASSDP